MPNKLNVRNARNVRNLALKPNQAVAVRKEGRFAGAIKQPELYAAARALRMAQRGAALMGVSVEEYLGMEESALNLLDNQGDGEVNAIVSRLQNGLKDAIAGA